MNKPPPVMHASNMVLVCVSAAHLPIRFTADGLGKAAEGGPSAWAPAPKWEI